MSSLATTTAVKLIVDTPKYYNKFRRIQGVLNQVTLPYIFIVAWVGLITNTATILLLSTSFITNNTRHKWTLIALALSDLVHNTALSIRVIHDINKSKIESLCIFISILSHLAELLSACYTVLFTIQRYRAVRYPLEAAVQKRSAPLVMIFSIFSCSLIFCLVLSQTNTYIDCHEELKLGWFIADALFSFIIPFSLILIFNIRIVRLIQQHARSSISKQSIVLKPLKRPRNNRHFTEDKASRQEESHSIVDSAGNSLVLQGPLPEIEFDNKFHSNPASNQKKNHPTNQPGEPSIPASTNEIVNSDPVSTSPRASVKSQNSAKKKASHALQSIRVTRMLVLVSTCFLILNAPAHLCVIAMKIYTGMDFPVFNEHDELDHFQRTTNLTSKQLKNFVFIQTHNHSPNENEPVTFQELDAVDDNIVIHLFYIAIQITQWISYASYSINFFLYSLSGISFRTGLREFWKKVRRH